MANEYIRKEWAGGVVRTTINGSINSTATTITVVDGSSFPSGVKPFVLVIDRGLATEEKIICSSRTSNTLTVLQRGYDGSTGQSHSSGAYIEHTLDAYTIDQTNALASTMTTQGDIVYKTVTGDNTSFGRLGIGTTGYPLVAAGTAPAYQQVGTTGISNTAITKDKINADVAGNGLSKNGTTGVLDVNVDGTTIAITADTLGIPDGAITSAKILNNTIINDDIASGAAIAYAKLNLASSIVAGDFAAAAKPVVICTSGARPGTPVEGQIIYETDTDRIRVYNGSSWVLLTASGTYSPTTVAGTMAVGTGGSAYNSANWSFSNGVLQITGRFTFGTTGVTYPTTPTFSFPTGFTAETATQTANHPLGTVWMVAGGSNYSGFAALGTSGWFPVVQRYNPILTTQPQYVDFSTISTTGPNTWGSGDVIRYNISIIGTWA